MIDKDFQNQINAIKLQCSQKAGLLGVYRTTLENVLTGEKEIKYYHNIITDVGRALICNNLTDASPDNTMKIKYAVLGRDATPVAIGDTQLGTETYRNAIASATNASYVAYATAYFNQTEVVGTFKEAGIVCDGTIAANSGVLFSHVNIDVTKTNVQKLTIDWVLTLLNA